MFGSCCTSSKTCLVVAVGLAGVAAGVLGTRALDARPAPAGDVVNTSFAQPEDPEAMMQMMAEWGATVEQHKLLNDMAGTWDCTTKFWMAPGDPMEGTGTSQCEVVLGGRFATQHFTMPDFMGQKFEGMGAIGFDKAKGKYVNVWMDNFSTGFMTMEGTFDKATRTMTWTGKAVYPGPEGTMEVPVKHVIHHKNADTMVMEFWEPTDPTSPEMTRTGEITYTRRK